MRYKPVDIITIPSQRLEPDSILYERAVVLLKKMVEIDPYQARVQEALSESERYGRSPAISAILTVELKSLERLQEEAVKLIELIEQRRKYG